MLIWPQGAQHSECTPLFRDLATHQSMLLLEPQQLFMSRRCVKWGNQQPSWLCILEQQGTQSLQKTQAGRTWVIRKKASPKNGGSLAWVMQGRSALFRRSQRLQRIRKAWKWKILSGILKTRKIHKSLENGSGIKHLVFGKTAFIPLHELYVCALLWDSLFVETHIFWQCGSHQIGTYHRYSTSVCLHACAQMSVRLLLEAQSLSQPPELHDCRLDATLLRVVAGDQGKSWSQREKSTHPQVRNFHPPEEAAPYSNSQGFGVSIRLAAVYRKHVEEKNQTCRLANSLPARILGLLWHCGLEADTDVGRNFNHTTPVEQIVVFCVWETDKQLSWFASNLCCEFVRGV